MQYLTSICLIIVVLGIPLLYVFTETAALRERTVEVSGTVEQIYRASGVTIVYIRPTTPLPVVSFRDVPYVRGQWVIVNGTVKAYQGRVEIVVP